jgi:ribosome maturation factor RimP
MAGQRASAAGKSSRPRPARAASGGPARAQATGRDAATGRNASGGDTNGRAGSVDRAAHLARLRAVVEPVITEAGYDLEALSVSRVGRRHLVRIAVDSDAGVDLDAVAELSRRISSALDAVEEAGDELIAGEYELEVGSPGVDRPLTEPRHWRRSVSRLVQVRAGDRQVTGRVVGADADAVDLDIDGTTNRFRYDDLGPGRVQIEFKRLAALDAEDLSDEDLAADDDFVDDDDEDVEGEDEE